MSAQAQKFEIFEKKLSVDVCSPCIKETQYVPENFFAIINDILSWYCYWY